MFSEPDGAPISPLKLSGQWRTAVQSRKLPMVSFHGLRHSHTSALLASGADVLAVNRRLGHASPVVMLGIYAQIVTNTDEAAAKAMENALRTPGKR